MIYHSYGLMSSYEEKIYKILINNNIYFEQEKTFYDLHKGSFRYDFYIPNLNNEQIIIEVDGEYHFKKIKTRIEYERQKGHDRQKNSYCLAKNIKLIRIPYWEIKNIKTLNDIFNEKFIVKTRWHNDIIEVPK